jgi:ADP-heptose:LPS heptosyltransferase
VCAPLIAALRDAGHEIGIALSDRNAGIFDAHAFVAQHVLERIPWPQHGSTPASTERARAEITAAAYDVALIVSEEPEAYDLARCVRRRVGFATGWSKPLKSFWVMRRVTTAIHRAATVRGERAHEVEIIFRLGAGLHTATEPPRDAARLRPLVMGDAPHLQRRGIVVQLGAKWRTIGLDATTTGAVIAMLAGQGAQLIGSPADRDAVRDLAGPASYEILPDMATWKRTVDAARIVVTPDTGTAHLAGMLGVPVVDLFPDHDAASHIARWHPWAAPYTALTACELRGGEGIARIERVLDAY